MYTPGTFSVAMSVPISMPSESSAPLRVLPVAGKKWKSSSSFDSCRARFTAIRVLGCNVCRELSNVPSTSLAIALILRMRARSSSSRSKSMVVKLLAMDIPTKGEGDSPIALVTNWCRDGISSSSMLLSGRSIVSSLSCVCKESTCISSSSLYKLFLALSNFDENGFDVDAGEMKPFLLPLSIIWSINSLVSGGNSNEASSSPLSLSAARSDDDFGREG
mmetsp:Transcript_18582/g.53356  ORF Transcript_18582/g.53356 Transcript_18582/m.53356 type:complete len:219 (-) Transcript_18582:41-697(-)